MIINEGNVSYIKLRRGNLHNQVFIGAPNKNQQMYLYTSKNQFTRWKINYQQKKQRYQFKYIGEYFNKSKIEISISRYSENIEWAEPYQDIVTVYNKGKEMKESIFQIYCLPNIGRESMTHYQHIIRRYNNLSDYTLFLQGEPTTQNVYIFHAIDNYFQLKKVQNLGMIWQYWFYIPTYMSNIKHTNHYPFGFQDFINKQSASLHNNVSVLGEDQYFDKGFHVQFAYNSLRYLERHNVHFYKQQFLPLLYSYCGYNLNSKVKDDNISFGIGGIFGLSRESIIKNPLDLYQCLFKINAQYLEKKKVVGEFGYVQERQWMTLFGYEDLMSLTKIQ